ncbi:hypothetical protein MAR_003244 [Mya arenaria]|uniref:Uncharacterized protein n=1 Tax=Mya arenaria TaxID=6604 RepID=A0ABY7G9B8_MYAAR|nr:hypothetical protein MAR_003244 [Mya arenaria]
MTTCLKPSEIFYSQDSINNVLSGDNRRLWVLKHLERLGKIETIKMRITGYIPPTKLTSANCVRGPEGGRWHFGPDMLIMSKLGTKKTHILKEMSGKTN